jgi:predicted ATPase
LLRRWSRAKAGLGQAVLLSGEAGIGKSRLTAVLLEAIASEPHTRLRYFCSPQRIDSAFYPIINQLERAAGLARDDAPQSKVDKLDALLAAVSTSKQDAALFAELLSLPNDGRYPTVDLTPQERRQRTLDALMAQMAALSRQNPLLMIFDDAHWSDPTSLEALGRAVDRLKAFRILLLATFRPEFQAPWVGRPYVTSLTINRLTEREAEAMIDRIVGDKPLPSSVRRDIIERTDGIPLFVEEMTKAVLEAGSDDPARRIAAAIPSATVAVPPSLQASLMARLDRLGSAKDVAQIGAAIGREFSHALLSAVVSKPEPELALALDRLIAGGLLFRQGVPPYTSYLFKHALVQDAAYGTLLREPRRALHARIVETLENQFAESEGQPEILARHCTEAGLIEKAAGLWGKAGQGSLARSALVEATEQLTRALDQIAGVPSTPALRREQIKFQVAVITPLIHVKGYAALETRTAVERARQLMQKAEALGEHPEDPLLLFSVLYGFWAVNTVAFRGDVMRELAAQILALAEKQGTNDALMIGHRLMGLSLSQTGNIAEGRTHLDQSVALYDPAAHRALATRFGQDMRVVALTQRACDLWALGYPEAGLADADHALKDAREIGHAATLMSALSFAPMVRFLCEEYAATSAQVDESVALADKKGASYWKALGMLNKALVSTMTAKTVDAAQKMASCIVAYRSTGATFLIPWYLSILARAYAEVGLIDDAWRCIQEAVALVETTKERLLEAEFYRIAGEITLMTPKPDTAKAQAYFERALAIARQQQAKSLELRAAMSMARLWRDQGKREEARELLAPVYGWFTEGFDTRDLKEAKVLLDELAFDGPHIATGG